MRNENGVFEAIKANTKESLVIVIMEINLCLKTMFFYGLKNIFIKICNLCKILLSLHQEANHNRTPYFKT